jgi:hypothetical protein
MGKEWRCLRKQCATWIIVERNDKESIPGAGLIANILKVLTSRE